MPYLYSTQQLQLYPFSFIITIMMIVNYNYNYDDMLDGDRIVKNKIKIDNFI